MLVYSLGLHRQAERVGRVDRAALYWVPGHFGVDSNERANKDQERVGKSLQDLIHSAHWQHGRYSKGRREEEVGVFEGHPGLRQAKIHLGDCNRQRFSDCLVVRRNGLRVLVRMLIGHCRLRGHFLGLQMDEYRGMLRIWLRRQILNQDSIRLLKTPYIGVSGTDRTSLSGVQTERRSATGSKSFKGRGAYSPDRQKKLTVIKVKS